MGAFAAKCNGSDEDFAPPILTSCSGEITFGAIFDQLAEITPVDFNVYDVGIERHTDARLPPTVSHYETTAWGSTARLLDREAEVVDEKAECLVAARAELRAIHETERYWSMLSPPARKPSRSIPAARGTITCSTSKEEW